MIVWIRTSYSNPTLIRSFQDVPVTQKSDAPAEEKRPAKKAGPVEKKRTAKKARPVKKKRTAKKAQPVKKKRTGGEVVAAESMDPASYAEMMALSGLPAEVGKQGFLLNEGSGGSIVEVCAGSCRLSKALLDAQVQGGRTNFTIECFESARSKEEDILLPANRTLLLERICKGEIRALWCAPPCATWSRSRRGKITPGKRKHWPLPLRDDDKNIEGLFDTMTAKEAIRVREANELAKFLGELVKEAEKQGIMVIVENPSRSRLWKYPPFSKHLSLGCTE